jgi:HAD superfamily phosphoserine phosphatase-like hydrolase
VAKKVICFDIDGTLVDGVSWLLLTSGLGCLPEEHLGIFHRARKGEITFSEGEKQLTKLWREKGRATKSKVHRIFSVVPLKPGVAKTIRELQNDGWQIYLISGAIDMYVEEIAKKIQANGWFANSTLDFDEEDRLAKIHYRDNQGQVKVEHLRLLSDDLDVPITEIVFVGNGTNDLEAFDATQKGIAVYAEEELSRKAWKVANEVSDIPRLLSKANT